MSDPGQSDRTLLDALKRHLDDRSDRIAYHWGTRTWTFGELERDTNRIADTLAAQGVRRGDRIALLTKHHVPCILLTLGALKLAAVCMPVNWRLAPAEAEYVIGHGQARLLLVGESFAATLLPGGAGMLPAGCAVLCPERALDGATGFEDWYSSRADDFRAVEADTDDAAFQLYSSGTTGLPKGVVLTHRGLLSTSRAVISEWQLGADGVLENPLPTFHVAGMTILLLTLYTGGTTSAYSEFDRAVFIDSMQSPAATQGDYRKLKLIAYGGLADFRDTPAAVHGRLQVQLPAGLWPDRGVRPRDFPLAGRSPARIEEAFAPALRREADRQLPDAHRRPGFRQGHARGPNRRSVA